MLNIFIQKAQNNYMYFNYHAKAIKLINEGKLIKYEIVDKWNNISPALVLFFSNHIPMPIRKEKWDIYLRLIKQINL